MMQLQNAQQTKRGSIETTSLDPHEARRATSLDPHEARRATSLDTHEAR
jgi:hypothetical protein